MGVTKARDWLLFALGFAVIIQQVYIEETAQWPILVLAAGLCGVPGAAGLNRKLTEQPPPPTQQPPPGPPK